VTGTSTGYARPMPALGFDPAPGEVGSTAALARRYAEMAAEIAAVQTQVADIDLARWKGKAAGAARARQAALVQALGQAAATMTSLGGAATRWSPLLATYQAEADALERQAVAEQANHQYLATRAPQVPQLTSDLAESATSLAAMRSQAEQLHQEYLATADLVMDAIPGVGEVAIAATGLYLAGDFLYHHRTALHDVANDIGHATVTAADDIGHGAASAWHSITSSVGSWF
jgi:hypothetical protein